jgi:hypothetical protein
MLLCAQKGGVTSFVNTEIGSLFDRAAEWSPPPQFAHKTQQNSSGKRSTKHSETETLSYPVDDVTTLSLFYLLYIPN